MLQDYSRHMATLGELSAYTGHGGRQEVNWQVPFMHPKPSGHSALEEQASPPSAQPEKNTHTLDPAQRKSVLSHRWMGMPALPVSAQKPPPDTFCTQVQNSDDRFVVPWQ
jgi:hypothetical protein